MTISAWIPFAWAGIHGEFLPAGELDVLSNQLAGCGQRRRVGQLGPGPLRRLGESRPVEIPQIGFHHAFHRLLGPVNIIAIGDVILAHGGEKGGIQITMHVSQPPLTGRCDLKGSGKGPVFLISCIPEADFQRIPGFDPVKEVGSFPVLKIKDAALLGKGRSGFQIIGPLAIFPAKAIKGIGAAAGDDRKGEAAADGILESGVSVWGDGAAVEPCIGEKSSDFGGQGGGNGRAFSLSGQNSEQEKQSQKQAKHVFHGCHSFLKGFTS